jgi:hypothetical protein
MSGQLHNANEALKFLQGKGIDTSVGRVFLASDVERAMQMGDVDRLAEVEAPRPKTMAQAKRMVRMDEELMANFNQGNQRDVGGPSISAGPDR